MVFSGIIQQQQLQQQSREFPREKKLDLNAPLMSVRRHQLEASSSDDEQVQQHQQQQQQQQQQQGYPQQQNVQRWGPDRKSEVCCSSSSPQASKGDDDDGVACWGSLRSPGAVPFVWERTPGRPKFESAAYTNSDFAPGRNSCSSPSLPPGRTWAKSPSPSRPVFTTDSYRRRQKDAAVADVKAQQQQQQQQQLRQKHRNKLPPQVLCNDTTTTSSRRKHAQRQQLGELFKNRGARSFTSESDEQQLDQVEEDAFSDAPHSDSITLDPPAYSKSIPADDPAARDFILRRFLPAAKAMADESASSTPFASPLVSSFSPRKQAKPPQPQQATLSSLISHPSTRDQASPSVERIQKYQYKFASSIPRSSDKTHDDFFALKACGFFSFALRHFRPQYPSSRLRRSSDRANNRFAADDFHTSIFVKKVNGGLTIRHESEAASEAETEDDRKSPGLKKNRSDRSELNSPLTALKSPKSFDKSEKFYDCNATFSSKRSPVSSQNPEKASYYRGSMSPFPERHETKGFLGLPENYKPPEDPYRNVGYSPPVLCRNANQRAAAEPVLPATLAKRLENNMLADADVKVASSPIASHRNQAANLAVRNGETRKEVHWSRPTVVITPDQFERPPPLQSPARNHVPSSPTGGVSPLLPPKSPAQSWLWKTLPQSPSTVPQEKKNAKWEATVKSRKLRPGHLRYSEENALQQCEY